MSSFKKFNIQWAWFVNKRGFKSALRFATIIQILAFVSAVVFVLGFLSNNEGKRIISNDLIQIIGGISALVFFYLYIICSVYGSSSNNFKIAIDKAEKFVTENLQCDPKISILIAQTEQTKNPAKLNEWIDNWEKLSSAKADLQGLKRKKEDIEKGIPFKEVNAEIEEERERIEELESELA